MGKKLAIKGHSTRGNEVIKLLEMMGGSNVHNFTGCNDYAYYVNDGHQNIIRGSEYIFGNEDMQHFTLEEFIEKFPFKIGDKVLIPEYESEVRICRMNWDGFEIQYKVYRNDEEEWYTAEELLNYNDDFLEDNHCNENQVNGMKNVLSELSEHIKTTPKEELEREFEEIKEWSNVGPTVEEFMAFCECKTIGQGTYAIKIADGYKFDRIDENGNIIVKPIKPKYPTTYDECCDVLSIPPYYNLRYHTYEHGFHELATSNELIALHGKLNIFGKLLICRTAYWKIAGEQMGLDRPWKPDWNDSKPKYTIVVIENKLVVHHALSQNYILAFPTEEIRDAFYENFNDLIEACKELL